MEKGTADRPNLAGPTGAGLRVLLLGQAKWTRELATGLSRFAGLSVESIPIDTAKDALRMLSVGRFRGADVILRVGFRPGAHTVRGEVFDSVFNLMRRFSKASVAYYWLGTDAVNALKDRDSGLDQRRFREMAELASHMADSETVQQELASLGLRSTVTWLPAPNAPQEGEVVAPPSVFTVLSYIPDARSDFFGGPELLEIARRMPSATFRVVGGEGTWAENAPANVEFLGWRGDMGSLYDQSSVLVRTLEHDSVSCMAVEALAHGRPVIYSSPFPNVIPVAFRDVDGLELALRDLACEAEEGAEPVAAETVAWARHLAEPSTCYGAIADALREAAREPHDTVPI